jgi:hypothetical protein
MTPLTGAVIGSMAGLIVSSWQGFKDPPWEGFSLAKFLRSILVGAGAGGALAWFLSRRGLVVDNPGVFAFAVVAIERTIGEGYKGFFRRGSHAEYLRLLTKLHIPATSYFIKVAAGIGYLVGVYWLFRGLARLLDSLIASGSGLAVPGIVIGLLDGVMVGIGGALKDSQFEGFIPLKFVRSPIAGMVSGAIFVHYSANPLLVVLATVGGERVGVECYKTFLRRQVRGMFAGQPPRYPEWIARRGIFTASYFAAVTGSLLLLFW